MAYIGFNPSQQAVAAFATKLFTGDGTTTTFTLDQSVPGANEANVQVVVENVLQNPIDAYTISGALNNQLVFSEAPATGAAIYVIHKGEATYNLQPSTGSVTAETLDPVLRNFTVDTFTGNGSTATFTLSAAPYSPNSILVMVDGIVQTASTNYTLSGNTLSFGSEAPATGAAITVIHLGFASGIKSVMDRSITPLKLSTGGPTWDTNSVLYIGTASSLGGATNPIVAMNATANNYVQSYVRNTSTGTGASADLVAYPDNGTDAAGWIDMGITSSTFSSTPFGITGPNEGYLFMSAPAGASKSGNMVLATDSTGTSNAIVFATGGFTAGTEKMRIGSDGKIGVGINAPVYQFHISGANKNLAIESTTDPIYTYRYQNGSNGPAFFVGKSRSATVGQHTAVQNGDALWALVAQGSDGTNWQRAVNIFATVDNAGSVSTTSMPGKLSFQTSSNGSVTPAERLYIDSNGIVGLPYGQIKFPAVQNASSDPNTLDDYEEGTWPATLNGYSTNPTYTTANLQANYVKVGGVVHAWFVWFGSISAGGSGGIYVGGLPFALPSSGVRAAGVISYNGAAPSSTSGFIEVGSNQFLPIQTGTQAGVNAWTTGSTQRFFFQVTYTVNNA